MTRADLLPVPMIAAAAVLAQPPRRLIDLRSPGEFAADRLPGAVNVPLFDDLERALIGTLYARRSPESAFEEGRRLARARIAGFSAEVAALCGWELPAIDLEERVERMTDVGIAPLERALASVPVRSHAGAAVFYCWRGGLRSRAVIAFLRGLGREDAFGIAGGYRAYRAAVRAEVAAWRAPPSFVLRGLTGVGKTLVLRALAETRPMWALDVEGLAGHRSSILGMVGLVPASQKLFESRLVVRLRAGLGPVCVVEGESRKVGDLILPDPVWRAIDGGVALELVAPTERRVRVLLDDYLATSASREELAGKLPFIETRLGKRFHGELVGLLRAGREAELVEVLLAHYYDPLYHHSERGRNYVARFDATSPAHAAAEIVRWIERAAVSERAPAVGAGAAAL